MNANDQGSQRTFVGVEASNMAFTAVAVDQEGQIVSTRQHVPVRAEETLPQLTAFIDELREPFGPFETVGVAIPGLIHRDTRRVAYSAHSPEHSSIDIVNELRSATGLSTLIENDANAAAYGEYRLGAGRGANNMFYATLGAGVGGAFVFDGKVWHGDGGFAGEFGYVAINSDGMRLEDVASTANIVRRTRSRFHQDSTSSLNRLDEQEITIADIVNAASKKDDFAQMMLERTGVYVGTAIASVINLLNIERIVIGGEIMQAADVVLNSIIRRARELSFGPSFKSTKIVQGELGGKAAAAGMALLAKEASV